MRSIGHWLQRLFALVALAALCACGENAEAAVPEWPGKIEAARGEWNVMTPPADGWVVVGLPDDWSRRWPRFDGVVWYRFAWNASVPLTDSGLYIEYMNMAGVVRVNDAILVEDKSLVEPLTRTWNLPRYLRLGAPVIHAGENLLYVRVSGLAAYDPGLGPVHLGAPVTMREAFEQAYWIRQTMHLFSIAVGTTIASLFFVLWLLRRRETAYGWFAASQLCWMFVGLNHVVTSVWPFPGTDSFEVANTAAVVLYLTAYAMFVLRFCGRRWPRREVAIWLLAGLACVWLFSASHDSIRFVRDALTAYAAVLLIAVNALFVYLAWRGDQLDRKLLSLSAAWLVVAGIHDALMFMRVIGGNEYYATLTENFNVVAVAIVLAWNFVQALRRSEGFNLELKQKVEAARVELATTLERQHELELMHARLGERLSLAHDLHDGLGGMLIGNIASLEEAPEKVSSRAMLDVLRQLRDDLRLIIDTASSQTYGEDTLGQLVALLRHRITQLFEARKIAIRWRIEGVDQLRLTSTQSMDILRILQEALANVLKHSAATGAEVDLVGADGRLRMEVRDDGVGLRAENATPGTGMRSMRARAQRLGAQLAVDTTAGVTSIRLDMPLPATAAGRDAALAASTQPQTLRA